MDLRKVIEYFLTITITLVLTGYGFFQGLNIANLNISFSFFSVQALILDAISSSVAFTIFITIFGAFLIKEIYSNKEIPYAKKEKPLLAIIPVYNEADILHKSVEGLKDSDYENLDICVVCEEGDEASIDKADQLGCKTITNNYPGSKAGAINTAFEEFEDYSYYAIFDSDEQIQEDFLKKGVGLIQQGYEAFEGRRVPKTGGMVEAFSYCERFIFYLLFKFMELTGFHNLGSASVIMKRQVWEKTGGFDDMLTEDLDFHHKSFRANIDVVNDRRINTLMEAPHNWKDFWNQRKRWRMGWVQVLHKTLTGGYSNYKSLRGLYSTSRIIMGVVATISILILIPKILVLALLDLDTFYIAPLAILTFMTMAASYKDRNLASIEFIGPKALLSIAVLPLTSFLTLKSLIQYLIRGECEWYQVEKRSKE
jgi:cellulose synthase/poly-beta-1,6-N-acetylglucosamine synthase-like glycosyltransferase